MLKACEEQSDEPACELTSEPLNKLQLVSQLGRQLPKATGQPTGTPEGTKHKLNLLKYLLKSLCFVWVSFSIYRKRYPPEQSGLLHCSAREDPILLPSKLPCSRASQREAKLINKSHRLRCFATSFILAFTFVLSFAYRMSLFCRGSRERGGKRGNCTRRRSDHH